eukprot:symbB.v1.2.002353.t3/scaffold121.1/size317807/17
MVSFVIAGKASDPSFARAEYAAKQVQAMVPNIFVKLEMKHPDHWKSFLATICRLYDFSDYPEDFSGPLVWTLEGELIGGAADFVQKICIEQFGIQDPPAVTDPMFKEIAAENLKQVKMQLQREHDGPALAERCATASLASYRAPVSQRSGAFSAMVLALRCGSTRHFSKRQQPMPKHLVLVNQLDWILVWLSARSVRRNPTWYFCIQHLRFPIRWCLRPAALSLKLLRKCQKRLKHQRLSALRALRHGLDAVRGQASEEPPAAAAPDAAAIAAPGEVAPEEQSPPETSAPPSLLVPPHRFRSEEKEDLSLPDFIAAVELLSQVGGVATWSAIRGGSEFRHPLETHVQVLPFSQTESLRYPLELLIDRCTAEAPISTLPCFPFEHFLLAVPQADGAKSSAEIAKSIAVTYDSALTKLQGLRQGASRLVCFTTTWMLVMRLTPPEPGTPEHQVWLKLPPLHPCALCGIAICPEIEQTFPETAGGQLRHHRLVSSRAEEEGIPEDAPEYGPARNEARFGIGIDLQKSTELRYRFGSPSRSTNGLWKPWAFGSRGPPGLPHPAKVADTLSVLQTEPPVRIE